MKKVALLLFACSFTLLKGITQRIPFSPNSTVFHANDIRTKFLPNGMLFWDGEDDENYVVPFVNESSASTIFNAALWLGVKDGDSLRVASQTYELFGSYFDFYPGPLNPATGKPYNELDRENFNRVWTVSRHEIEEHILDFEENLVLDKPNLAVVGWPGHGNPYFRTIHGFELPKTPQGAAPFFDSNKDGMYNAFDGDFPLPAGVSPNSIPEQMIWLIYNDATAYHWATGGSALGVEIQLTAWAYRCLENPLLNKTLFIAQKIINRSGRDYKDVKVGTWSDIDIGCHRDDYAGCAPDLDTYFAYNAVAFDPSNCESLNGYGDHPPVQAVTLLNQKMKKFNVFYNAAWGLPPKELSDPAEAPEVFAALNGAWKDGTPLSEGGLGYDSTATNSPVDFAFPDDPNDPNGWSQFSTRVPTNYNVRQLGVVNFEEFKNGEAKTMDVAYSTHFDAGLNHIEQVSLVYEEVPKIRNWYKSGFVGGTCLQPKCEQNCIWPGDANNDGIVDHFDLLAIGAGYGAEGPARTSDRTWSPQTCGNWAQSLKDGTNLKYLDTDGNGKVDKGDLELVKLHFGKYREGYTIPSKTPTLDVLYIQPSLDIENNTVTPQDGFFNLFVNKYPIDSLVGIAVTIDYDSDYFYNGITQQSLWSDCLHYLTGPLLFEEVNQGNVFFAAYNTEGACPMEAVEKLFRIVALSPKEVLPSNSTTIRITRAEGLMRDGSIVPIGAQDLELRFEGFEIEAQEEKETGINIYPNPSDGVFYIKLEDVEVDDWQITDAMGRLLEVQLDLHQRDFMLDLSEYPSGIYYLKLKRQNSVELWMLVVQGK
ncbi:MAG: T9SS type A sorting domain-containing protein [Saprospiraceae bacterium]|nr:T9SS type A sorting domain-containing protein [Saprospiraceae bacterium]